VSDRFTQPEAPRGGDQRRIFIPAPSGGGSTGTRDAGSRGRVAVPPPPRPGGDPRARQRPPGGRPPSGAPPRTARDDRPWYKRVRWRWVLGGFALVLVLALLGGFLYARSIFNRIEKVEVGDSLTSASSGTNYLIVGSDSRENVTEEGDAGFSAAETPAGQRADTMMIMHMEGGTVQLLSVPRDLYLPIAGTGSSNKINAAYNADLGGGPERLIDTITEGLGIPIDRYMEIDFVSFAGLVDALGGVTIDIPHPATDDASGLFLPEAGAVELDGEQALAYVRSRHYTEHINGELVEDPRADIGRIERQQKFLTAVFGKLNDSKNPVTTLRAAGNMATGLRIDDEMSMFDAFRFAWGLRGVEPKALDPGLEFTDGRNEAGAVLFLDEEASQPALEAVR
jgi:LCP family protein required for cell wall assembly